MFWNILIIWLFSFLHKFSQFALVSQRIMPIFESLDFEDDFYMDYTEDYVISPEVEPEPFSQEDSIPTLTSSTPNPFCSSLLSIHILTLLNLILVIFVLGIYLFVLSYLIYFLLPYLSI